MQQTIFYSWQSELPNNTNRSLVERSLENAVKTIRTDDSIAIEPVLDRDTAGIAGSPEISNTILRKIDTCAVFVADVSVINRGTRLRKTPNPNVLIELGYAMRAVGPERIIMVMNRHYGGPELLPFDLKQRRVITYTAKPDDDERSVARADLTRQIESHLRLIFGEIERDQSLRSQPDRADELIDSIRRKLEDRAYAARTYMRDFISRIVEVAPSASPRNDEDLVAGLRPTIPLVADFGRVANAIATLGDDTTATEIYRNFGGILVHYQPPYGESVTFQDSDYDYYRFLGHELLVTFIAALLSERRLALLKYLLSEDIEAPRRIVGTGRRTARYFDLYEWVRLFRERKARLNLISAHGTLLEERHSAEPLAETSPFDSFAGADYFLFLHSESLPKEGRTVNWFPPTAVYLARGAPFLDRLRRSEFAMKIADTVGLAGIDELRKVVTSSGATLARAFGGFWDGFAEAHEPGLIASR